MFDARNVRVGQAESWGSAAAGAGELDWGTALEAFELKKRGV